MTGHTITSLYHERAEGCVCATNIYSPLLKKVLIGVKYQVPGIIVVRFGRFVAFSGRFF